LLEIEERVKEDTREIHCQKEVVDSSIAEIDKEIEELEALLEKKRQQRDGFIMDRQAFERLIDQSRGKYRDQIVRLEKDMDKVTRDDDKNTREAEE
jgi:parvulin-like peptidyl-prolyl isomerase